MKVLVDKAEVLIEALPYMRRFVDKTIVIKYGGHAMIEEELRAERFGKQSTFIEGLRVTDDETMDVVEMVLGGKINREIVELVQRGGGRAVGLTGSDGAMLRVRRKQVDGVDIGRVGEVISVNPQAIAAVAGAGFVPVVAPIGADDDGLTYNVNADEAAGAIARALQAEKLILLTDVEGVMGSDGRLIGQLTIEEARKQIYEGSISGGMIPKIDCCIDALSAGVARTHIIDGRILHAVLLEIFTDGGVGTLLVP
jgi:acetylglutamate kinase